MPQIVIPNENLFNAPSATTPTEQGNAPLAPSATTPVVTPRFRRLTIFYQNGNTTPAPPVIDREVDIAQPILDRFAEYTSEISQVNNIPIVGLPVKKVGFKNEEDTQQPKYIDTSGIPDAATEFNGKPTQFPIETVTPDSVGVNYKNDNSTGPRNFSLNIYQKSFINNNDAIAHGRIVDQTLLSTRGHNSVNKTITPDISQEKNDGKITLGSYFYKNIGNNVNYVSGSYVRTTGETQTDVPVMTIDQMKVIGLNIMFEAVQGRAGLDYTIREESAASKTEAEARMVIPSEQRIGKRVSLGRFTSAYQIQKLTGVAKPNSGDFIDTTDDVQTYGSFYNVYSQFDSLISLGQIALAVAMIIAYTLVLSGLVALINAFNLIGSDQDGLFVDLENDEKKRLLGASVLQDSGVYPLSNVGGTDIVTQFLGVQGMFSYTRHRTEECLNAGIQEFFGLSFSGFGTTAGNEGTGIGAGQQVASTALRVLTENGRLNVILRELLRSGITLVEDTAADFTGGASIAGIGNLIRKIRDFKIVRFINVLMGMGDKVKFEFDIRARAAANQNISSNNSLNITGSNVSYVDSLPDIRQNYIAKSRLSSNSGIAWSNKTAGMLSLPLAGDLPNQNAFNTAGFATNQSNLFSTHWDDVSITVQRPPNFEDSQLATLTQEQKVATFNSGRLSADIVEAVESKLEADYMPFYIHDLRTNEILSFHAFLEDASEDFQIEYSAQEGYGRMDKVQIYKGTTRNISVNFKMVATSQEDHDVMWYKLNRLAMMIYPQWTQGRKISVENIKFIQPFSQIPGATPVIRLRLGDLYKTNYSKMAVARLFGITTNNEYNVDGSRVQQAAQAPPATGGTAPAQESGNGVTQPTPTREERADRLLARQLGAVTQDENATNDRHRHRTGRTSNSTATYAIREVFAAEDKIILKTDHFPNLRNYRLGTGTDVHVPTTSIGRILARVVSVETVAQRTVGSRIIPETSTSITIVPEKYLFDPAYAMQNNQVENVEATPSVPITGVNGQAAPQITLSLSQLQNQTILDRELTSRMLRQMARNDAHRDAQASGATQTPAAQNATIRALTPQTFYDPNKNPIMKAFRSSGGKGLAGVITSFKIDYGEAKANWGIDGSEFLRAPMFVTIQLQMAVIHDITPGLDAKGIMNAPIWPVGKTSNYFVNNGNAGTTNPTQTEGSPPVTVNPAVGQQSTNDVAPNDYFAVDRGAPLYYNRKD